MHQPTNGKAAHPVFVALYDRYNDPKKYKSDNTLPEKKKTHTHTHRKRGEQVLRLLAHAVQIRRYHFRSKLDKLSGAPQ